MGTKTKKVLINQRLMKGDKAKLADEVADLVRQKRIQETSKKDNASMFTARIKALDEDIVDKATIIHDGYQEIKVECDIVPDYRSRVFMFYRVDNGELVKTQKMTQDEAQQKLPFSNQDMAIIGGFVGTGEPDMVRFWGPYDHAWQCRTPLRTIDGDNDLAKDIQDELTVQDLILLEGESVAA